MKVGDLVQIQKWCKNKGALAIVVGVPPWRGDVYIRYLDGRQSTNENGMVRKTNLILVSES